ncbi:MAG: MFS transporter, partial [Methyloceanibacter sp.]
AAGLYGIGFWMPQVIQTFGFSPLKIGFLAAIPYLFAAALMVLWGRRSDRTGERIWHVALPLALAGMAFAWSAVSGPLIPTMIALTLVTVGIYAAVGAFWSLPTAILTGTGAAAGIALVNSIGNLGGFAAPTLVGVLRQATGDFTAALFFLAFMLVLGAVLTLLFGYSQRARNPLPESTG